MKKLINSNGSQIPMRAPVTTLTKKQKKIFNPKPGSIADEILKVTLKKA